MTNSQAFADRLFTAALGAIDVLSIHLGDRMGWYRALAEHGPATPAELVARAGGAGRYATEWLEQQAATGILDVRPDGRFVLPEGAAEVLTDPSSLTYLAPLARMISAAAVQLPALLEAYRTGGGVPWAAYGADMRESQADMNRPWFEHALPAALAGVADLHALLSRPGARIADLGCGAGWSTIALARAYPGAQVTGVDVDAPSIDLARSNAALGPARGDATSDPARSDALDPARSDASPAGGLSFRLADATTLEPGRYDAVFAFECVHDLSRPVETLAAARRALAPGGQLIVMDEAVADAFTGPADEVDRLMYGFSLLVCLPDGLAHQPSAGTGTVMRPSRLRTYAQEAGFGDVEVLPIEGFGFWRFYRLLA
ncbi:class I SAM-dependent methyltransferase [Nonomuraea soli]|uniref:SAM-dependent methyltransferase n=1 Tax=Nonomuraea soli TaxID=1032476 RepID=A0A7W0CP59_9ACTN|nr:class I SAM-dependent methyltransferase [Nonomuraea soli]MBA2894751.1 SAM-dependent methyltransferase [Nonomuraea soli]